MNYAGGRYLGDAFSYNLNRLQWAPLTISLQQQQQLPTEVPTDQEAPLLPQLQACAGQSVTPWHGKLVLLGGHVKVRLGQLFAMHCSLVRRTGALAAGAMQPRTGHAS